MKMMRRVAMMLKLFNRRPKITFGLAQSKLYDQDSFLRAEMLEAVPILQDLSAEEFYIGGHHRKLAIVNREILWEGSFNILSQSDSCEIMRRIESKTLVEEAIGFTKIETHSNY
jgi:hypothetical protein